MHPKVNSRTESLGYPTLKILRNFQYKNLAIELDPKFIKGYYRRASAHMSMGKFKLALKDYENVSRVKPNDPDVKKKLAQCKKVWTDF